MTTPDLPNTVAAWLRQARCVLSGSGSPHQTGPLVLPSGEAALEAALLLAHGMNCSKSWLYAHPETLLSEKQVGALDVLLKRRLSGEPLPYLLGHWEFFGLDFTVTPDVLIPRPETELLVEEALAWLQAHPGQRRVADVGAGSGCIGLSVAANHADALVYAVDLSYSALKIAYTNAARLRLLDRVSPVQADLLTPFAGPFDLVCANLPYLPIADLPNFEVARFEPHLALAGGDTGLETITALLRDAPRWLAPHSLLLLEIEYRQGALALRLMRQFFPKAQITLLQDLAGNDRLIRIEPLKRR